MSIQQGTIYFAECDSCGAESDRFGFDETEARDQAERDFLLWVGMAETTARCAGLEKDMEVEGFPDNAPVAEAIVRAIAERLREQSREGE